MLFAATMPAVSTTISIVTICFNNIADLIATCSSVDEQSMLPFEHLIVDGSTNKEILDWLTVNIQPSYRKWIHERDDGISDAFNKGIVNSHGDVIHLLNAGDRYADKKAIDIVSHVFDHEPGVMWTQSLYIQHRGKLDVLSGVAFDKQQLWKGMRTVAHPTMFLRKELYQRHGLYNAELKVAMDYDLLIRIKDEPSRFIPTPLVYFSPGGVSSNQFIKGLQEVRASYRRYMRKSRKQAVWQLRQRLLHSFMKTVAGRSWFKWKNKS